jgi:hypothetical protein
MFLEQYRLQMIAITEKEFSRIVSGVYDDREVICRHNPIGTREEILLWMTMCCLSSYLSLSELESPCFPSKPDAETYRQAIGFILSGRMKDGFDHLPHLEIFRSA